MIKSRNAFIARHLDNTSKESPDKLPENFLPLLKNVMSDKEYSEAKRFYEKTQSVVETLAHFKLSNLAPDLLERIIEVEKQHRVRVPLSDLSKLSLISIQIFELMKLRLSAGLTYALALTAIASIVFYTVSNKVLTQFEQVFSSFGAELPALTLFALSWSNSIFPPSLFVVLLFAFVAFVLHQTKNLASTGKSSFLKKLPFLKNIFNFLESFAYLSELKIFASAGLNLKQINSTMAHSPKSMSKLLQYSEKEIEMADELGRLNQEIEYQIEALALKAENVVISSTRALIGMIMSLVIAFVGFVLIASYLPIFQLGSGI